MKISILIANKNYGEFLRDAIDSALAQEYSDVEVVVVDDGSTDHSRQLITDYAEKVTAVLGDFGGQIAATNAGFERCRGDVVVMLDSDDRLRSDAASLFAQVLSGGEFIKASGYLRVVDGTGEPVGVSIPRRLTPSGKHRESIIASGPGAYRAAFNSGNAWTRAFLERVLPIPLDSKLGPDGYLNLICPLFGATATIDDWVADYRIHGRNAGPVSRRFTLPWLRRVHDQHEASRVYLSEWISRTNGPENAHNRWRLSWRSKLVRHCLYLMTGQRHYYEPVGSLVLSPCSSVGTRPIIAIALVPTLLVLRSVPRSAALSLAGRLLGFSKIKDEVDSRRT